MTMEEAPRGETERIDVLLPETTERDPSTSSSQAAAAVSFRNRDTQSFNFEKKGRRERDEPD